MITFDSCDNFLTFNFDMILDSQKLANVVQGIPTYLLPRFSTVNIVTHLLYHSLSLFSSPFFFCVCECACVYMCVRGVQYVCACVYAGVCAQTFAKAFEGKLQTSYHLPLNTSVYISFILFKNSFKGILLYNHSTMIKIR